MQRRGIIPRLWEFLRNYLVLIALMAAFGTAMFEVYVTGTRPVPQQPPEGYTIERLTANLQWNKGTRHEPITLQISMDDPDFERPILEREVTGTSHAMKNLEPGHTYYWRLVQGEVPSRTATFKISRYAVAF